MVERGPFSGSVHWRFLGLHPEVQQLAPEKWWLEDYFPIGFWSLFRGELLNFGGYRKPRVVNSKCLQSKAVKGEHPPKKLTHLINS